MGWFDQEEKIEKDWFTGKITSVGGKKIPDSHASHLRSLGYDIPTGNILENESFEFFNESLYIYEIFEDGAR